MRRLRERGVRVWVTDIETVPQAIASLERLFDEALGWPRPDWLAEARRLWCGPPAAGHALASRSPSGETPGWWSAATPSPATCARRLGCANVFADHAERYPRVDARRDRRAPARIVVLLPDEPYVFTPEDGPEAFTRTPTELVSGRLLTWYGPSLIEAHRTLARSSAP